MPYHWNRHISKGKDCCLKVNGFSNQFHSDCQRPLATSREMFSFLYWPVFVTGPLGFNTLPMQYYFRYSLLSPINSQSIKGRISTHKQHLSFILSINSIRHIFVLRLYEGQVFATSAQKMRRVLSQEFEHFLFGPFYKILQDTATKTASLSECLLKTFSPQGFKMKRRGSKTWRPSNGHFKVLPKVCPPS